MSMRIMAFSSSNMNSASARASSVLPTPVGPRKMKLPMGRLGSCRPARARRRALAITSMASSWPTTRWCSRSSMWMSFSTSPSMQPAHRDAGPLGHHLGDVLFLHLFLQHLLGGLQRVEAFVLDGQLLLQPGDDARSAARRPAAARASRSARSDWALASSICCFSPRILPMASFSASQCAFMPEDCSRSSASSASMASRRPREAASVSLERACRSISSCWTAPLHLVDLRGHGVDLDAQAAGGFVHQVDGLVRQEAVLDVAVGEHGRRDQRRVLDAHAVVHLVALLQAAQDGDGVLHRGLAHQHRLEAALQRRVLLHVLAVLVEGGGAHHAQFAPCQHGLQHVGSVDGTLGRARRPPGVHLVDEGDDLALPNRRSP